MQQRFLKTAAVISILIMGAVSAMAQPGPGGGGPGGGGPGGGGGSWGPGPGPGPGWGPRQYIARRRRRRGLVPGAGSNTIGTVSPIAFAAGPGTTRFGEVSNHVTADAGPKPGGHRTDASLMAVFFYSQHDSPLGFLGVWQVPQIY